MFITGNLTFVLKQAAGGHDSMTWISSFQNSFGILVYLNKRTDQLYRGQDILTVSPFCDRPSFHIIIDIQ